MNAKDLIRYRAALITQEREFISERPCVHGHGRVRKAYGSIERPHIPCAECARLHGQGFLFGSLPRVAERPKE